MSINELKRIWIGFWQLADPKIWIASTIPMAVGGALAYGTTGKFSIYWFLVALASIYLLEIGKNAVNEIVDFKTGVDLFISPDKKTPFSGGKKTIVEGKLKIPETAAIALLTIGAGCCIGLYIVFFKDLVIFWVGLLGVLLSIIYSLPPIKLAYRGWGELTVGLTFGPLIVSGIYILMTGTFNLNAIYVSLPIGLLIANVLWINQFPDYEADKQGGKANWVVRLGKERSVNVFAVLFTAAFACMVILAILLRNPVWLLSLAGLPQAYQAVKIARKSYNDIPALIGANIRMVMIYQITGITMVVACISYRFI